tara:strand:- start:43007 stop:43975 length:969 start_codon:yes stop_codon:yes gene_type:complete
LKYILILAFILNSPFAFGSTPSYSRFQAAPSVHQNPYYDIPVTYNHKIRKWVQEFQSKRRRGFQMWLSRSHRYLPKMRRIMKAKGLPLDLSYIALIESGLTANAISSAKAVGYWQFMLATGKRYGLKHNWWLDERRDFYKSTEAAAEYLADLYKMFGSWYLTAAAYNMGENRLKRLIKKYNTKNFWKLSEQKDFPKETREYIPKLIATVLIAKVPQLYGFKNVKRMKPYEYEYFFAPGGTDLVNLATFMGFTRKHIQRLNPSLIRGFIPSQEKGYWIRIPKGHLLNASAFIRRLLKQQENAKVKSSIAINDKGLPNKKMITQ